MEERNLTERLSKITDEIKELREQIAILQMEQSDLNFKWLIADSDCYISTTTPDCFDKAIEIYTKLMHVKRALFLAKYKLRHLRNMLNGIYGYLASEDGNGN